MSEKISLSPAEKERLYRSTATRLNLMGHYYIGFEGPKCSQLYTDNEQHAIEQCAWVWGKREKKWIKKPEGAE